MLRALHAKLSNAAYTWIYIGWQHSELRNKVTCLGQAVIFCDRRRAFYSMAFLSQRTSFNYNYFRAHASIKNNKNAVFNFFWFGNAFHRQGKNKCFFLNGAVKL